MPLLYTDFLANPRFTSFASALADSGAQQLLNDFLAEADLMFSDSVYRDRKSLACCYYAAHMHETLTNAIAVKESGVADPLMGAMGGSLVTSISVSQENRSLSFGQADGSQYSKEGVQTYTGTIWGRLLLQLQSSLIISGAMIT